MRKTKEAFTLVELMVVITIMVILSMMVYAPYQHFQTKQKVRNSAKIVSQTLYEARNLAINGSLTGTWNSSIWVLFASWATDITLFQYPFEDVSGLNYADKTDQSVYLFENKKLEPWVKISWKDYLMIYEAISGSGVYLENWSSFTNNNLELSVWIWWADTWNLNKKIKYYTKTYVADVQ